MAERLAKIFGTEEDKVNCPFYFKIGACRHGDTCTRIHNKPPLSQTMVFSHLYENPGAAVAFANGMDVAEEDLVKAVNHFEDFYEEVFMELCKFGELEDLVVADNIGDHMIGNAYAKYNSEDQAKQAMNGLNGRFYAGRTISAEFSPVTDFREAKCRMFNEGHCDRGGYCNFMHPKHVSRDIKKQLFKWMYEEYPLYKAAKKLREEDPEFVAAKKSRSRSREKPQPPKKVEERRADSHRDHRRDDRVSYDDKREKRYDDRDRGGGNRSRDDRDYRGRDRGREDRGRDRYEERDQRDHRDRDYSDRGRDVQRSERRSETERERPREDRGQRDKGSDRRQEPFQVEKDEGGDFGQRVARMNSQERRAMIAGWHAEPDRQVQNKEERKE